MTIDKAFNYWTMDDDERYSLDAISTSGDTLEELIDNCRLFISDWHGNEARSTWTIGDLSTTDYNDLVDIITEAFVNSAVKVSV